ncbi:hypothetical protein PENDEC_c028G00631 [Penicillium decumbens]|uniref:MAGE domain-containing protein n=1 Tax=Penicillium decumbens TaxID=69771 RepID=A0A1V6NZ76_PENDC|nr:hypothetical protein PENDEC_c028G00631 [Penicillium decumbens]
MSSIRKRRADQAPDPDATPHQRARASSSPEAEMSSENAASSTNVMIQKLVRLALSSEYPRLPIRRADISTKVLGEQGSRQFKLVFEHAQRELRHKFGMEMTELPAREKITITQRRAAQKTEKPSSTNKSWILTSTLPAAFRTPAILTPTKAPSSATESTYTALYSFIIAVISLNGGALGEQKLERYLARMNAETYTPIDRTDRFLARLCKEGYLVRTREMDGGEEIIEYMAGPRGKIEVGTGGVSGLVREVYGIGGEETEERAEFETRLKRSLGIVGVGERAREEEAQAGENEGRSRGGTADSSEEESDSD